MKDFFKKHWLLIGLIIVACGATIFYSFLSFSIKGDLYALSGEKLVFNSPDETANYFFADLYSSNSRLNYDEPDNFLVNGIISPRSMRFINGQVTPASFFGLMLFLGSLGKLFGSKILIYILPILSAFCLIYFYLLVKKIFNQEIAFFSTLLTFIFPAYWYYATRSFFNNVLFLDFLIIGLYYLLLSFEKDKIIYYLLSALFLGGAIFIRTSEFIWLSLLILLIFLINWKKLKIINLIIFLVTCLVSWLPIFYYNQILYGQFLAIGYNYNLIIETKNIWQSGINLLQQLLLPFGINKTNIFQNFNNYFLQLFWWYFILFELGYFYFLTKILSPKTDQQKVYHKKVILYFFLFTVFSLYLIIFYGSWKFSDHPDPQAVTLGTSYARYFLPIYIFSLPFISYFLFDIFTKSKILKVISGTIIFCLFFYFSFNLVFFEKEEGLIKVRKNIEDYQKIAQEAIPLTAENGVIIAERNDKIFFPQRKVIYELNNDQDYQSINLLLEKREIYWWRFQLSNEDLNYLNNDLKKNYRWFLDPAIYCHGNQCLYPLKNLNKNVK